MPQLTKSKFPRYTQLSGNVKPYPDQCLNRSAKPCLKSNFVRGRKQLPCFGTTSLPLLKETCKKFCISSQLRRQRSFIVTIWPRSSTTILRVIGITKIEKGSLWGLGWCRKVKGCCLCTFLLLTSLWKK